MARSASPTETDLVRLRDVTASDLNTFFEQQLDPEANYMAAFTPRDPANRASFDAHWKKILDDRSVVIKTILFIDRIAGHVGCHGWYGDPEVTYWIGRSFWGKGIATAALRQLLENLSIRPLYARAAGDNLASIRVLEKCGFTVIGSETGFANGRHQEIEEVVLRLR